MASMIQNKKASHDYLSFPELDAVIGGRLGKFDLPCPVCSPHRRKSQVKCLRVWHDDPGFLTYHCVHCGTGGYAHSSRSANFPLAPTRLAELKAQATARSDAHNLKRRAKAESLWKQSSPARTTLAQVYFNSRGITCPVPATLRFLTARDPHPPTIIAAFGIPDEPEPGILDVGRMAIKDVHLTLLRPDGMGKADVENPKITLAPTSGLPIVVAPVNDNGGLAVAEGIEDALSVHQATGLGAWAAGTANRLPALGRIVPTYVGVVTILVDDDDAGRNGAHTLAAVLTARGISVELLGGRAAP